MQDYVPYIGAAIAALSLAYTVVSARAKASADRVAAVESLVAQKTDSRTVGELAGRVDAAENRLTKLEAEIGHMPDKDVTHRLEISIGELRTEVQVLSERMKPIAAIGERVQEALLEKVGQ